MVVSAKTYEQVALEDLDADWELDHGVLRPKSVVTTEHNNAMRSLTWQLARQLDAARFEFSVSQTRLRTPSGSFFVPDVFVILREAFRQVKEERPQRLEWIDQPAALVIEVWSPSTGEYDATTELAGYRERGDAEIWLVHPYERVIRAWRQQPDGTYAESLHIDGVIEPIAVPGVRIEIAALFD